MNIRTTGLVVCTGLLFSGCHKDGLEPSKALGAARLTVRFDPHCDGKPFHPDSVYTDGFGTRIRFEAVRFALVGVSLSGDQGQPMGEGADALLTGGQAPGTCLCMLEGGSIGDIHWIDTRILVSTDAHAGALDSLWVNGESGSFLAALDVAGRYDSNCDGQVNAADAPFRIAVRPDGNDPALHIHAHGTLAPDATGDLEFPVNLSALLHDIDIPDDPITIGTGPYATQALINFRSRVLGADNKPI